MTATPSNYLRMRTGNLTLGSQDMGHMREFRFFFEEEYLQHFDVSDSPGVLDKQFTTKRIVAIEADIEEIGDLEILAYLMGDGTVADSSFPIEDNNSEYSVTWYAETESAKRLRFRHTKCALERKTQLNMAPGDTGGWTGMTLRINILKDSGGTYGDYGKWDKYTA
jgi:hypothetical protein